VLNDLVSDADKRARLGAAARATAEKFSPATIADKYLQLFQKVISGT
jgi:glycosyltransferase involved in cell wall biosynthesis